MSLPFMREQTSVRINVLVLARGRWPGSIRTVFGIRPVGVLRPKSVQNKSGMLGAFGCCRVRVAKLRRPGQVEEIKVEARRGAGHFGRGARCAAARPVRIRP